MSKQQVMARIRAGCPQCGAVRLRVPDVTVRMCADDEGWGAYRFRCPACAAAVAHEATPAICALLTSVGVRKEIWHLPAELFERPTGPAFTADDLLDFHLLLEQHDWFERLAPD
jgi:hypothetical protein